MSCSADPATQTRTLHLGASDSNVAFATILQVQPQRNPCRMIQAVMKIWTACRAQTILTVMQMTISMWLSVLPKISLCREIEPWKSCALSPSIYVPDPCCPRILAMPLRTGQTLTMAFSYLCGIVLSLAAPMSLKMRRPGDITLCRSTATSSAKCVQR